MVFLTWQSLEGLLLARVLAGVSIGLGSSTAGVPGGASCRQPAGRTGTRAELTATAANMGGPCGLAGGVSPRVTILGFAIAVAIGIVASAVKLLSGGEAEP